MQKIPKRWRYFVIPTHVFLICVNTAWYVISVYISISIFTDIQVCGSVITASEKWMCPSRRRISALLPLAGLPGSGWVGVVSGKIKRSICLLCCLHTHTHTNTHTNNKLHVPACLSVCLPTPEEQKRIQHPKSWSSHLKLWVNRHTHTRTHTHLHTHTHTHHV